MTDIATKPHSLILYAEEVRAVLDRRELQFRRLMKPQPSVDWDEDCEINGEHPAPWFAFDRRTNARLEHLREPVCRNPTRRQWEIQIRMVLHRWELRGGTPDWSLIQREPDWRRILSEPAPTGHKTARSIARQLLGVQRTR